jgi:hypothetical protein
VTCLACDRKFCVCGPEDPAEVERLRAYYEAQRIEEQQKDEVCRRLYEAFHPPWSHMQYAERLPFITAARRAGLIK